MGQNGRLDDLLLLEKARNKKMKYSKIKLQMLREKNFEYDSKRIKSAEDIVKTINQYEELEKATQENVLLICLDTKNKIICYSEIAKGGLDSCYIDITTIFKTALLCNSNKFILIHNHPSGTAKASQQDIRITKRIKDMAEIMDMQLLDHIIIGENDFISCM